MHVGNLWYPSVLCMICYRFSYCDQSSSIQSNLVECHAGLLKGPSAFNAHSCIVEWVLRCRTERTVSIACCVNLIICWLVEVVYSTAVR